MAKKKEEVKVKVIKKDVRQKIIVAQSRHPMFGKEIPYHVIYKEIVPSKETAEARIKELKEEYKDLDAVCVNYFSL